MGIKTKGSRPGGRGGFRPGGRFGGRGDRASPRGGGGRGRGFGGPASSSSSSASTKASHVNPFDAVGNRKAKFEVLNKRAKGQVRNVGKARQLAVERRKKTLLVEYHASKKDNVFKDRRFGEDDPSLSLEEKMLLRFQKERQKRARKSGAGRFNLEDPDEDEDEYGGLMLTHKGKALGAGGADDDYQDQDGLASSDDDEDGRGLNKQIVKELHFGGGGQKRPSPEDEEGHYGPGAAKRTRAELMEEIIAKSKLHKAAKAKQKDAQEMALSRLDDQFTDLVGDLEFRDKDKSRREEKERDARQREAKKGQAASLLLDEDKDYDELMVAIRDERFAARAQDRTMTPEEVAKEEKEKLERLEAARLARMRGGVDAELAKEARSPKEDGEGSGSDDVEEEDEEDGEGLGQLGRGWDADSDSGSDSSGSSSEGEDSASESGEEQDAHDEEKSDENGSGSGSEEEEDDEEDGLPPALLHKLLALKEKEAKKKQLQKASSSGEDTGREGAAEEGRPIGKAARQNAAVLKAVAQTQEGRTGINPQMPYVLDCPTTLERYVELVKEYAQGAQDVAEMITRIRRYHAIRSGGDRGQMHNFYDVLMRRLACLGDALVPSSKQAAARVVEVNALSEALVAMTQEMPAVAAALWGRMLTGLQAKLGKVLRDHELGQRAHSTWPAPGALLLLRLLPRIFPVTDFRHPVVTPALLYMGQAVSQCPLMTPTDVERGLFVVALMLHYTEAAGRLVPEAMAFLLSLLGALGGSSKTLPLPTWAPALTAALRDSLAVAAAASGGEEIKEAVETPLVFGKGTRLAPDDDEDDEEEEKVQEDEDEHVTPALATQYLATACRLLQRVGTGALRKSPAVPELFGPFIEALAVLERSSKKGQPPQQETTAAKKKKKKKKDTKEATAAASPLLPLLQATKAALEGVVGAAHSTRTVLSWRKKGVAAIQSLAPRIIDNFVVRKDEGLDRDAARTKQLTRQLKREKKGAARELRRDAAFLDAEKVRIQREREEARKATVKANTAWLEAAAADFNKQVKQHKGETLRGGGSAGAALGGRSKKR